MPGSSPVGLLRIANGHLAAFFMARESDYLDTLSHPSHVLIFSYDMMEMLVAYRV